MTEVRLGRVCGGLDEGWLTGSRASGISVESGGVILSRSFKRGSESGKCVYLGIRRLKEIELKDCDAVNVE